MMQPMRQHLSDAEEDRYCAALLAAFQQLHGCTILQAFIAKKCSEISQDQFDAAFEQARLMVETEGNA